MTVIKSLKHTIKVGDGAFDALNKFLLQSNYSSYAILCDEHVFTHCLPGLLFHCPTLNEAEIIELESGEEHKTIDTCIQVWGALTDTGMDKKSLLINLGGGVITDLGGFAASSFKRGIDFINIPTTLLAMVDAGIGGKTGVDFEGIKNHIGTTYLPKAVFTAPFFLETLSERHIKNGYAEVIKIALIADAAFWNHLKQSTTSAHFYSEETITQAIELKNSIVKKDPLEHGIRKSLNFGHSIGHALESALIAQGKDILHGEAIATGMVVEAAIARDLKFISKAEYAEIERYIHSIYKKIKLTKATQNLVLNFIKHDKKNEHRHLCFALPKGIGNYQLCCDVSSEMVQKQLAAY